MPLRLGKWPDWLPFRVILTLSSHSRVHTHAAAALINFCSGGRKEIITPYLRAIVSALSTILRDSQQLYVQHQVFTTMAMVADAAQASFRPVSGITVHRGVIAIDVDHNVAVLS